MLGHIVLEHQLALLAFRIENDQRLETLRAVAAETSATVNQIILAWMLARNIIPLIAASDETQLAENIGALEVKLSADQMDRLNAAGTT